MNTYHVRTDRRASLPADPNVGALDWFPGRREATIQVGESGEEFFSGWRPPREAADLFLFGSAVYCMDKSASRSLAADSWTRSLRLELPVGALPGWEAAHWPAVLGYLTGDQWDVAPFSAGAHPLHGVGSVPSVDTPVDSNVGGICLFSGGLDSLIGVIDLLERDKNLKLCLVSHHEGGQASTAQQELFAALRKHYGRQRLTHRRLFLRPAPVNSVQARPLAGRGESTTRGRSLLFLTAALTLAASISRDVPVFIPENGFIGINVPLTRARVGSFSTRTTHPHFLREFAVAARDVGVLNPVVNPYRLLTKGEMLAATSNPELLRRLAPLSLSCAHPEAPRWVGKPQGNCGYCFPCLIRRSSMARVGWDDPDVYAWDALSDPSLLKRRTRRGADLRAVIMGAHSTHQDSDILRNGPIPDGEHAGFLRVWRAGTKELRTWLDGASGDLRVLLDDL